MEFWSAGELANRRLVVRGYIKQWNQMLAETAHKAGVITTSSFRNFSIRKIAKR